MSRFEGLLVERLITFMGHDRRAFCYIGAKTTRMVEVVMRVHQVADGFRWRDLLGFGYHCSRPLFVQWGFYQRDVIRKFHEHTVMRTTRQVPDTVGKFLTRHSHGRRHRL